MEGPFPSVLLVGIGQHHVQHHVPGDRHGTPHARSRICLARLEHRRRRLVTRRKGEASPSRVLLVQPVHHERVVRERGAVPFPVARIAVGDAAGILRDHLAVPPQDKVELVRMAVAAAVRTVIYGHVVVGHDAARARRAAAHDCHARFRIVQRRKGRRHACPRKRRALQRVGARCARLLGKPPGVSRIAPPCPGKLVQVAVVARTERDAPRVVHSRQLPCGRHLAERRVEHLLEADGRRIAEVGQRRQERREGVHRVEVVAPRALEPAAVGEDALLELHLHARRRVDRVGHPPHVSKHQSCQPVGGEVPALVVVDAETVALDQVGGRTEELLLYGGALVRGQRLAQAVIRLEELDQPHGLVKRLRKGPPTARPFQFRNVKGTRSLVVVRQVAGVGGRQSGQVCARRDGECRRAVERVHERAV